MLESVWNLLQNAYDITHLTLRMLPHYLGKLKIQIFCRYWRKRKQVVFLIASNFVIHPQILTKLEAIKICNLFAFFFHICRKFEFLVSQGSVATCRRWDGYCRIDFVANFTHVAPVQKFWKSVKIWQSYRQFKGGNFFLRHSVFLPCGFYLSSSFFPRSISAVADWMSTILQYMVWT